MNVSGRLRGSLRAAALWGALGLVCIAILLAGIGFLIDAFYAWQANRIGHINAAALTGAVLLVMALFFAFAGGALIRRAKGPQPTLLEEFSGTLLLAGRIIGLLIRRDPRKALVFSIIAGALAEYMTSERKK
jgi:hypothetical protein